MNYECLIHLPSKTFCGARSADRVAAGDAWSAIESDPAGEYRIESVDLVGGEDREVAFACGLRVMASQIDAALVEGGG